MKFLAITDDSSILPWLEGIRRSGDEYSGWWLSESLSSVPAGCGLEITSNLPADLIRQQAMDGSTQCLLIAGRNPALFMLARELGQFGLPVLVVTTSSGPTSTLFELMPLWEEQRTLLLAGFSSGLQQRIRHLLEQVKDHGPATRIEFVRTVNPAGEIAKQLVHQQFFQDVHWLTTLAQASAAQQQKADWEQVLTVWTGERPEAIAQGMVTLSGDHIPETTWTLRSGPSPEWSLTVWRSEQSTILRSNDVGPGLPEDIDESLKQFRVQVELAASHPQGGADSSWNAVLQCGHMLAAVQSSATRQRRVAVHFESGSERSQFKSQMSTFGCAALLWAMFGMIAMLLLTASIDPRDREQRAAEAVGFILDDHDFNPVGGLSADGQQHISRMASQWSSTTASVVIAVPFGQQPSDSTFPERQREVLIALRQHKLEVPNERLVIRPVVGQWFQSLVIIGWIFVFGPLAVLLLAQGLIIASHPGRSGS